MKLEEIETFLRMARQAREIELSHMISDSNNRIAVFLPDSTEGWIKKELHSWLVDQSQKAAAVLRDKLDSMAMEYTAKATGLILEARQEERLDAYLDEIVKAFGPHQGLNDNWAVMAWHLGGEVWLCDDENDKTVSIVTRRITTEIDEIVQVASSVTPARALQIWAMISEEGR